MANSDKNIVITPNRNLGGVPEVSFTGFGNSSITLKIPDSTTATLNFESSGTNLLSIDSNLTSGSLFKVVDSDLVSIFDTTVEGEVTIRPQQTTSIGGNGLILPRYSTSSLPPGEEGLIVYDTTEKSVKLYSTSKWINLTEPEKITNGLVLDLDAGALSSYPGTGTGSTWTDLSNLNNNNNTGTLVNGVGYNSANGGSLVFDGADDRVECANSSTLNITTSITMESWIYPTAYKTSGGGGGMIITKLSYYMELAGNGLMRLYFYDLNSPGYHSGTIFIPLNTWSHVVGIRDLPNNSIRMYVNGVLDREITSITGNIRTNSTAVTIGSYGGPSYEYTGRIATAKIYDRALTTSEVQQNFNVTRRRFGI